MRLNALSQMADCGGLPQVVQVGLGVCVCVSVCVCALKWPV